MPNFILLLNLSRIPWKKRACARVDFAPVEAKCLSLKQREKRHFIFYIILTFKARNPNFLGQNSRLWGGRAARRALIRSTCCNNLRHSVIAQAGKRSSRVVRLVAKTCMAQVHGNESCARMVSENDIPLLCVWKSCFLARRLTKSDDLVGALPPLPPPGALPLDPDVAKASRISCWMLLGSRARKTC